MTKDEILAEIKRCAEKLGRPPSFVEFKRETGICHRRIRKHFGRWTNALDTCEMVRCGSGYRAKIDELFRDWAAVVRKIGKIPGQNEYSVNSRYSVRPLLSRFGTWKKVANGMYTFAAQTGIKDQYRDVIDIIAKHQQAMFKAEQTSLPAKNSPWRMPLRKDRPVYGAPIAPGPLIHEPVTEDMVIFLFGMVARELGFAVARIQADFPDCQAVCEVGEGKWQDERIEFELLSSNFLRHMHDPDGADLIVCWEHDWPECPIPVLELKSEMKRIWGGK